MAEPSEINRLMIGRERGLFASDAIEYLNLICDESGAEIEKILKEWAKHPDPHTAVLICGRLLQMIRIRDALNKDVKRGKRANEGLAPHLEGAAEQTT